MGGVGNGCCTITGRPLSWETLQWNTMRQRFKTVCGLVVIAALVLHAGCASPPDLQVLSLECDQHLGSHHRSARGEVRNVSFHPLHNLTAIVTFRSGDATVVERMKAHVHSPLGPGETSPFEAIRRRKTGFSSCEVVFTDERGWVIPHRGTES